MRFHLYASGELCFVRLCLAPPLAAAVAARLREAWRNGAAEQGGVGSGTTAQVSQQPGSRGTRGKQRAGSTACLLAAPGAVQEPHPCTAAAIQAAALSCWAEETFTLQHYGLEMFS